MKKLYAALMMFAGIFLLSACNGSSGDNEPSPTPSSNVSLSLLNAQGVAQQSFSADETITLLAKVTDENNAPISGRTVIFSADIGELSLESKLTDSAGEARVTLSNNTLSIGAGSAVATANEISSTIDYEFSSVVPPSLHTEIRLGDELTNQFKTSEQVQVSTTFIDNNNQPIAGEIITFSADIGELSTNTALTNEQGVASVSLTGNGAIGAGVLTAMNNNFEEVTASQLNYEIFPDDINSIDISLSLYDTNGNAKQSFSSDESITLIAKLLDEGNNPVTGRTVTFSVDIGELSVESKLTDGAGEARVTLTNSTLSIGAGSAVATANEISSTIDYEFLSVDVILPPSLHTEIRLGGELTNQFKTSEQVQVSTTFIDNNNQPIADEIITFSADIGELSTNTALTNEQGVASVSLTGNGAIGAGVLTAVINESTEILPSRINYEIVADDIVIIDEGIRIGYFEGDDFIEGKIKLSISDNTISAGGTLGLTVDLVDGSGERISTPTPVSFTSSCVQSQHATIDATVSSIKGKAESTFEDIDCAGISGTDDVIIATVTVNGTTNAASETISISGEELGSIEFISAEPTSIVLKGTGGVGKQEYSTLTFSVKSSLGNPLGQQPVDFVLDTQVGGIEITPVSGLTNSQGLITTRVNAGSVPTTVRVTAKSSMMVGNEQIDVQTQSDLLSVNTGLPEQSSMTISAEVLNTESYNINGVTNNITAQLADNFNNPVPDGTTVNFTTEGGSIEGNCTTINGACSVTWTSSNPKPDSHRVTILATASGHETFFESNGNNIFDDEDGSAVVVDEVSSGRSRITPMSSGFVDMSEAWRDDNENDMYDNGERFIDFNNDKSFSVADGKFNGPQCEGALCAAEGSNEIHVRKSLVMIMSSSGACYQLLNGQFSTTEYADNCDYIDYANGEAAPNILKTNSIPSIADGSFLSFNLKVSDTAFQSMPNGTSITVSASVGELDGITSLTVGNTTATKQTLPFIISNPVDGEPEVGTLTIEITSPAGIVTSYVSAISLL